jgi:MFS superfamily sulfate permease-like transporter
MGAIAGIYGAIAIGMLAAWFGGTATQISGPTGPMTVVSAVVIPDCTPKASAIGAPFLLHETLGCPIANLHSARSDLWEPQFVLLR